ncbi:hypothetical protein [Burkholderia seminalis]|uniref:hypothetical protein n=1 Tax=Burkholderia seminalis TaxID=488731 RepID=UPI001905D11E|nr:hypothetical protein [Burkholderia seminalis]MBJ9964470.1 hypothetical protein [Burkholderia seminalis]
MGKINDGGPAFPIPGLQHDADFNGMTKRDLFAMHAMQGICAHMDSWGLGSEQQIADKAYVLADAMLRARGAA